MLSTTSHEITEAQTDPLLDAWYTAGSSGFEIGDLCAYDYGHLQGWDGGKANQNWNGHFYELQAEFDNEAYATLGDGCSQVGPFASPPSQGQP